MHRVRFGSLVDAFLRHAPPEAETAAFAAGMATHAALDRSWHPYVVYHAGWVVPGDPATRRLRRCHAFLERVLDVLLAERLRGDVRAIDVFSDVHLGEELPSTLRAGLVAAIAEVYPRAHDPTTDHARVGNAYRDALRFFAMTDPRNPGFRRRAIEMERREQGGRRRLAIFHPVSIDRGVDWANEIAPALVPPVRSRLRVDCQHIRSVRAGAAGGTAHAARNPGRAARPRRRYHRGAVGGRPRAEPDPRRRPLCAVGL